MKKFISSIVLSALLIAGCNSQPQQPVIIQQAAPAPVQQVAPQAYDYDEYRQPNDSQLLAAAPVGAAATAMVMNNGMHYDGYHWIGPAPYGYYCYGGRLYRDTPYVRRYTRTHHVTVVKHVTKVTNVTNVKNVNNVTKTAAPVAAPAAKKVRNPGDAAAEAQKAQMQKQSDLKARLQAKRDSGAYSKPAASRTGGFNSMSRSASSRSGRR